MGRKDDCFQIITSKRRCFFIQ